MRAPPPVHKPPNQRFVYLGRGLAMLVIGMVMEGTSHAVVPWSYVPGQLALIVGIGIALAVLDYHYSKVAAIAYLLIAAGVFWFVFASDTSILPLFLYSAAYDLTRFGLSFHDPNA